MDEKKFNEWVLTLPETTKEKKLMLAEEHEHDRDRFIFFDEKPHKYFLWNPKTSKPVENLISVTTIIHQYFPKFDADEVIAKNMANWQKKSDSKYYGKTAEEIKKGWEDNGTIASGEGTELHKRIELFHNAVDYDTFCAEEAKAKCNAENKKISEPTEMMDCGNSEKKVSIVPPEWNYFLKFYNDVVAKNKWMSYRTEWRIWCEELRIIGTIDMIYINNMSRPSEIIIYDWKRSKEIKRSNSFQRGFPPLRDLEDCNFNHYSLQLNLYKYILEKHYGFKVTGMFLCICHPNNESYQTFEISPTYGVYVEKILRYRKEELENL